MTIHESSVLIVDDHLVNLQILHSFLKQNALQIFIADSGERALQILDNKVTPDLILLDVMMPGIDGFETCRRIKANKNTADIPVIFMTALDRVDDKIAGFAAGGVDYITKPFQHAEVLARITTHITLRRKEIELAKDLATGVALQKKFLTPETNLSTTFQKCSYSVQSHSYAYGAVTGDFFYPVLLKDTTCGLFFADTCGHGVSAALISMRIVGSLHTMAYATDSPANYLQLLNEDLQGVLPKERFVAAIYLFFNENEIVLSNAGQPSPLWISGNTITEISAGGYPIGQFPEPQYTNKTISLTPGDRILLYSDGLVEAENEKNECFGKERLFQLLHMLKDEPLDNVITAINDALNEYVGDVPLEDDISLIILEKQGPKTHTLTIANHLHAIGEFLGQFNKRVLRRYIQSKTQRDIAEYVLVECLDNAWEHGNKKNPEKEIFLTWLFSEQKLTISIEDQGAGFQVALPETMPPLDNPRGRGLFTLQDMTADLYFNESGNKVTFIIITQGSE
ncbi:SpoIIE family protein phosphatase [Methanococcoides sp. SA1]|nr:SpoIIE family protein phosphatase [Methanococcoides sp. SA1]